VLWLLWLIRARPAPSSNHLLMFKAPFALLPSRGFLPCSTCLCVLVLQYFFAGKVITNTGGQQFPWRTPFLDARLVCDVKRQLSRHARDVPPKVRTVSQSRAWSMLEFRLHLLSGAAHRLQFGVPSPACWVELGEWLVPCVFQAIDSNGQELSWH
jgi:hypothetical protein